MQTTIDLRDEDALMLTRLGARERLSSKELIEKLIAEYVQQHQRDAQPSAFGLWKDIPIDGLAYQSRLREEWPD